MQTCQVSIIVEKLHQSAIHLEEIAIKNFKSHVGIALSLPTFISTVGIPNILAEMIFGQFSVGAFVLN